MAFTANSSHKQKGEHMAIKQQAINEIVKAIELGYNIDIRNGSAYIRNGFVVTYIDWSMPEEGLIVDSWLD